ncbi:MAG: hypothetical protein KDD35_03685 [Bdellovibrionales bacterium]|nr:hypothetical protein [Bdellovibrionales bacterium]
MWRLGLIFFFLLILSLGQSAFPKEHPLREESWRCFLDGRVNGNIREFLQSGYDTWTGIVFLRCRGKDDQLKDFTAPAILQSAVRATGTEESDWISIRSGSMLTKDISLLVDQYSITKKSLEEATHGFLWYLEAKNGKITFLLGVSSATDIENSKQSLEKGSLTLGPLTEIR